MAYNPMTPQERMQRAAMLRAQREARLGYTPTVTEDLSRYLMSPTEQSVGSVAPVSAQKDDGTDALEAIGKGVATGLDLGANVAIGGLKSLEGIFDIGASLVGTVGGLFSEDFKREVEKVVAYQTVNELVENPLDELGLKHSYLNDSEIGEIIGGVAQGVGGMLPAVLVTVATGGTAAPVAVKQALSLGTMIAGAAGNASEEALNDGANLGQATNYGLVSGAIEGATEKLTGGASKWLIGKGIIKGSDVAEQGVKRILKNMGEEAVEEGAATFLNPAAKTTYKGAEALKEYGDIEFYGDVFKDSASGALTAGAFEQTVGRAMNHAGADADIYDAQEAIDNIVNKQRAEQAKGIYENGQLDADAMANLENISKALKKASPEKRAKLIDRHDLSQAFDESGEIKPEFAARFDGGTTTPQNGTMGATQSGRGYNKAYYSADKRGSEAQIASEVEGIQESLRNVERNRLEQERLDPSAADNITVKVFDGELSEQGKKNLANAHGFINNVSDRTRTGMSMVVVDSDGAMNGVVLNDSNTIYIDASNIEDGTYLKTMVEEVAHFSEGSESYGKLLSFIEKDEDLFSEVVGELVADGNGYGFTADTFLSLVEKSKAGERNALTGEEKSLANEIGAHMVAETFGNETFMQKVIKGEPTLAEKMIARIKSLKNALSGNESAEARTERKRLEKAEKLWMKSVEDAGYKYVKGKLIKRRREKEEEEKEKAPSSTENVQEAEGESGAQFSFSSISNSFFGDPNMTVKQFESGKYKETAAYQKYVNDCVNNMKQSRKGLTEKAIRAEVEKSIDGIVRVAIAMKKAGYDIYDDPKRKNARDSKNRSLFSSLEPNSDYFTSSDISTICDKRKNFAQIYDDIVKEEERRGIPESKRFFKNVDNYFYIHKVLADKGLTQPCKECYVESMRKNLAPMANAFLELIRETDPNNKKNKQLYDGKGKLKANNSEKRERMLKILDDYGMTAYDLNVDMITTEDGLAELRVNKPEIYEEFNSFYGQSKPKMPRGATPFRFGELTALLTDNNGNINWKLVDKINHTGGFRLQSYSDFQVQNFADVLQVIFEAGTLGLTGHAYTKVPMFLETTEGTNLKRNISIFMYNDGGEWKIDKNDSFPGTLEEIYKLVENDKSGNTSIIAVSQNADMSAWIMANDLVGYGIPFHKSGLKMDTVRGTIVKEGGREILGYKDVKDHTKQQTEVYAHTTADHKANTKVKKPIDIYSFWDFKNVRNLSKQALIKKNLMRYIDECEKVGYRPKFREYLMDNKAVLDKTLAYAKELGFVADDATVDAISFKYKGYRIPYGYYKFLGDFGMFTPDGKASPPKVLSLAEYDFDAAVDTFNDSEALRRKELLQQFANDGERQKMIESGASNEELEKTLSRKRSEVVDEIVNRGKKSDAQFNLPNRTTDAAYLKAVEDGDMETAQRMVDEAARRAGYTRRMFHETDSDNIHVFDISKGTHGGTDSETPYGIFTKSSARSIGLGGIQMALYVRANKTLVVENREDVKNKIPELIPYYDEIAQIDSTFDSMIGKIEDAELDALEEWLDAHPDVDMDEIFPTSYIAEGKPADIDSPEYHNIHDEYIRVKKEWENKYNAIAVKCKEIITSYLRKNKYDSMYFKVDAGSRGRQTDSLVVLDADQVKSADPVTYDDKGNVIPLSKRFNVSDPDIRFSLPNKNVKRNANRERSKTYTRSESNAIVDTMIGDALFGYGEYVGTLKGKGNIVDALWVKLNSTDENGRKKYAFKLADAVIDSMVLNLAVDDPVMEVYTDRVEKLGAYVRRLDLTSINDELKNTGNAQHYRSRWQRYDRKGMTPDQIVSELAENGIIIEADNPADILFEIDAMYTEALQGIKDNSNLILEQVLDKAELDAYRNDLARRFLEASNELGSASKLSREYYEEYLKLSAEYEHAVELLEKDMKKEIDANTEKTMKDIEKRKQQLERERQRFADWRKQFRESEDQFRKEMREKFADEREEHRVTREIIFRAERLKKLKLGKMHDAAEFNPDMFKGTIGALGGITRGAKIIEKNTRKISGSLSAWLRWHMKQINTRLAEDEGRKFDLEKIADILDEIADPTRVGKDMTVSELKNLSYAMARLTTYAADYGKVIRNGQRVDALPIVERYIDRSNATRKIPRGAIRTLREWYIGKFADPATVMRYADGYDEHGFFTETYNEFREGAIKVEVTRMELMEDYVEFLDKHKKYSDHLREYVEYRGKRVPRNVLISLWMTTKRKQAQLGLVMEGAQFRAEPDTKAAKKTDDGTRVFDIAPFGDPMRDTKTDPYTDEEIETIMEGIRTEIEKSFTDTDRSYIAMVEGIFKECGEIKRGVDMERLGYTNVDEKQYYFPIARADIAQTIEQESWQQGLDRVSHLSMNKDTVKGAHNRLYLSGVDAILARHVNQVSLYNGIATAVDNFNLLVNLKINEDGAAITVNNTVSRTDYGKAALDYLKKLKSDIERVNRVDLDDAGVTKFLAGLRGVYATSTLGANPKVWVTQLSSFIAANNVLDGTSITKGMGLKMGKVNGEDEVDIYCPLAKLRNDTNTAYEAQSVSAKRIGKVSDVLMKPIGMVDRFVVERLWGACQVQVEKNGGAKVGTKENKEAAGKLLQKVILETQQNSLATERSSAMRSTNEVVKSLTMFSADAMKMIGRFFDAYGEASFIRQRLKDQTLSKTEREKLEARKKGVDKQVVKSTSVLLSSAIFMAAIAAAFKALLGQYEKKEPEEVALDITADGVGNLLSGLPLARDVYSYFADGFELNMHLLTPVNGLLDATKDIMTLASDGASGKNVTSQQIASATRKGFFAGGQILGLPTKNVYKYATSVISLVSPETGYAIDSAFTKPSIKADLKKAIEAGDTKMVARIAEIATSENYGMYSESTRKSLRKLVEAGYTVFPRTVGDTVTVDGETYELSSEQKKRFARVYAVSDKAVEELVKIKQFKGATDEVKAKALKYVYDTYYAVALDDLMGTDTTQKSVLFAEVLDVELLAMVVAYVSTLAADKDKDGKTVNGSRKHKVVAYVNSLNLSAAEKYMIMGYLGYKNTNGKNQVESLINRSSLSRTEKATLLAYSGY